MNANKSGAPESAPESILTHKDRYFSENNQIISEKEANLRLKNLYLANHRQKFPSIPENCRCTPAAWTGKPSNALTRKVIDFLRLSSHWAERVSNTGRMVDNRKTFVDVAGRARTIGTVSWIKGSGTRGTSDIHASIAGRSVFIEIKTGADKMSAHQVEYAQKVRNAGAEYWIVRTFGDFLLQYDAFVSSLKNNCHE